MCMGFSPRPFALGNLTYYKKLDDRSAISASFRYFSLGEIEFRESANDLGIIEKPNELTVDVGYSLKLNDHFLIFDIIIYFFLSLLLSKILKI